MKNVKHQNVPMNDVMTEQDLDPGTVKATDFQIENQDPAKKRRELREADSDGKSQLGLPIPDRNKARSRQS
jgi:hypothetical protein